MKAFFGKYYRDIIFALATLFCAILFCTVILFLNDYSDSVEEQAKTRVELYTGEVRELLSEKINLMEYQAEYIAKTVSAATHELQTIQRLRDAQDDKRFNDIAYVHFLKDGIECDAQGNKSPSPILQKWTETVGTSAVYYDIVDDIDSTMRAFFVAVPAPSETTDAVIVYYPASAFRGLAENGKESATYSEYMFLCTAAGQIVDAVNKSDIYETPFAGNVLDVINATTGSKPTEDTVESLLQKGSEEIISLKIKGKSYMISVCAERGSLRLLGLYDAVAVYPHGYQLSDTILSVIVIFMMFVVLLVIYFIINKWLTRRKSNELATVDRRLNCPTIIGFEAKAEELLHHNRATHFSVIVAELKNFHYYFEALGEDGSNNVLAFLRDIYRASMQRGETFAYISDGMFVLLLHYREKEDLRGRLVQLFNAAHEYRKVIHSQYQLNLTFGVYEVDWGIETSVSKMIDKATVALHKEVGNGESSHIKFYNEQLRESYVQTADVEARMEGALKNNEFKIFYQPKYNIAKDAPDGSEALVRWYDAATDTYTSPGVFIPVFESNGFIIKLDKYIFTEICKYVYQSIHNNTKIYPISINVSRVTAMQSDFVSYYVKTKERYQIPDHFLTLEFTESFAYENYDILQEIVTSLHKSGFYCSIDDFGTGYSSYQLLKMLPMDEIKLDKIFVDKGISEERDRQIIESVIQLSKKLQMKITVEGVETYESMERLKDYGCDVIQGYWYSKPLSFSDYTVFIENTEQARKLKMRAPIA